MGKNGKVDPPTENKEVKFNLEEEVKESKNTKVDNEGTIYSCHYTVAKNEEGEPLFNGYSKAEILKPWLKGLNLYARVCRFGRFKLDKKEVQENGKGISKEAFEAFLEIIKCPV